jgi:hypothetical protein
VRLRILIPAVVLGVVVFVVPQVFGSIGLAISALILVCTLAWRYLYFYYAVPPKVRAGVLAVLDPDAGPPDGARPVESELVERMQQATEASDWRALTALLADDFETVETSGRRGDARQYVHTLRMLRRLYPDFDRRVDAVLADPAEPDVLWLRTVTLGRPRRGPAIDTTHWGRLTLAPGGERVRELATVGVVRVD